MADRRNLLGGTRIKVRRSALLAVAVTVFVAGVVASLAIAQKAPLSARPTVVACHLDGRHWVRMRISSDKLKTLKPGDVLASRGACPAAGTAVVCHLRGGAWSKVTVALTVRSRRLKAGDVLPRAGACPLKKRVSTTTTSLGPTPAAPTTTSVPPTTTAPSPTGGQPPYAVQLFVDGIPVPANIVSAAPYILQWNTVGTTEIVHLVGVRVTDATGLTADSSSLSLTVDNTAPSVGMITPAPNAQDNGPTLFSASASDAYGIKSVQYTVDGQAVGALLTAPDTAGQFVYSITFDTSTLTAGSHAVAAVSIDNAGNTTTTAPVTIMTGAGGGPALVVPVVNYHGIDASPPDVYQVTPAEADAQLKYLHDNGYQSIDLEQYKTWLDTGALPAGVVKPVLITVDDALSDQPAWDPLLQTYGLKAVMFVITGFVDNLTPGDANPAQNLTWAQIQALAANGRWEMAFHAGLYGHGDSYGAGGETIGGASYPALCPYFYTCLPSTGGVTQSVALYEAAVQSEISNGMAELKAKVPSASMLAWVAPFNDAGQWTNLYNDPTTTDPTAVSQVQAWFPGYIASVFPIVFTETNPITFAQASGRVPDSVGSLSAFGRRYRLEVQTGTTLAQFSAALSDPGFGR
jgi:uncharacterized membrane protein